MKPLQNLAVHQAARIATLERRVAEAEAAAARAQDAARDVSASRAVRVELDERGQLLIHLPGSHTLRWSLGVVQADLASAMKALVTVLRERNAAADARKPIGTPAAPTLDDLQDAIAESDVWPRLVPPSHRALKPKKEHIATYTLTLEDLGL